MSDPLLMILKTPEDKFVEPSPALEPISTACHGAARPLGSVEFQDRVAARARTGEGIEDQVAGVRRDLQDALDQASGLCRKKI